MNILTIALQFLPILIRIAEAIFGEKTGPEKKAFVLKELPNVTAAIGGVVTGGARETWKDINDNIEIFSDAIDTTVSMIFPKFDGDDSDR